MNEGDNLVLGRVGTSRTNLEPSTGESIGYSILVFGLEFPQPQLFQFFLSSTTSHLLGLETLLSPPLLLVQPSNIRRRRRRRLYPKFELVLYKKNRTFWEAFFWADRAV